MKLSNLIKFQNTDPLQNCEWGDFLFDLGAKIASEDINAITTLLVLPTIEFAAPLLASGYLLQKCKQQLPATLSTATFDDLPINADLLYNSSDGRVKAKFGGITNVNGLRGIVVRVQNNLRGNGRHIVLPHQLNKITLLPGNSPKASEKSLGRKFSDFPEFANHFFGASNLIDSSLMMGSTWLIGKYNEILGELKEKCITSSTANSNGSFSDLIRPDALVRSGEPIFSFIKSCYTNSVKLDADPSTAGLVIFREGVGYIRHRHLYKNANRIILMDFGDPNAEHVISTYNEEFYSRGNDWLLDDQVQPPVNIICAGYLNSRPL